MTEEIKEISKVDKQLLDKIEHILGSELSNEEYDKFYNYFNEIRKPNILIDIKDVESIKDYITNLQKENEELLKKLEDVSLDEANIRADILLEQQDFKSRNEKAIEYIKKDTRWFDSEYAKIYGMLCDCEGAKGDRLEVLVNPTNLLNILQGGDE